MKVLWTLYLVLILKASFLFSAIAEVPYLSMKEGVDQNSAAFKAIKTNNVTAFEEIFKSGNISVKGYIFVLAEFPSAYTEDFFNVLRENGLSLDETLLEYYGDTPLHYALRKGNLPLIKLILSCSPFVNKKNKEGQSAFDLLKDEKVIKSFSSSDYIEVHLLIGKSSERICENHKALFDGIVAQDVGQVRNAIGQGVNINYNIKHNDGSRRFLNLALKRGNSEIVQLILDQNPRIEEKWFYQYIFVSSKEEYASLLLDRFVEKRTAPVIKRILNNLDDSRCTPLHAAVYNDFPNVVARLLSLGSDYHLKTEKKYKLLPADLRSLDIANFKKVSRETKLVLLRKIFESGYDNSVATYDTLTFLVQEAINTDDFEYLQVLEPYFSARKEAFYSTSAGRTTALGFAIVKNKVRIVRYLVLVLKHNLNNFGDYHHRTVPYNEFKTILKEEGYEEMVGALLEMGARLYFLKTDYNFKSAYISFHHKARKEYRKLIKKHPKHPRELNKGCCFGGLVLFDHAELRKQYFPEPSMSLVGDEELVVAKVVSEVEKAED